MGQTLSQRQGDSSEPQNNTVLIPLQQHIPEEVLIHILSYVDPKTLIKLRLVCRLWRQLIDKEVWRLKVSREKYCSLESVNTKLKLPWYAYYWICVKDPFQKNLLKNHCGQGNLEHWSIESNGGDHWIVEDPPAGADSLPQCEEIGNYTSCFATSYHSCSKEQLVNLKEHGFNSKIMDDLQPDIEVSEWYAGRFDCGCIFEMQVELLGERKGRIDEYSCRKTIDQWEGREWHKVNFTFRKYGRGVRYIKFYHGGVDTQFWSGHYGSKMSGACVKLKVPGILSDERSSSEDESDNNGDHENSMLQ